eukprot:GHRR01008129.1.p2 GENE.GHRR01008129.1~~GHRR01008129.1.p2  ORF type:complete len:228 (+),score=58.22 GHRR01008129.1:217-900(+)
MQVSLCRQLQQGSRGSQAIRQAPTAPCGRSRSTPRPLVKAYLPTEPAAAARADDVNNAFKRLQNGSDVRGVALASKPGELVTLTPSAVYFIAAAFVDYLRSNGVNNVKVAVGADPRTSGPLLVPAVLTGMLSSGVDAIDVGLSTTPAMFYGIIAPGQWCANSVHMSYSQYFAWSLAQGLLSFMDIAPYTLLELAGAAADVACTQYLPRSVALLPKVGWASMGFSKCS